MNKKDEIPFYKSHLLANQIAFNKIADSFGKKVYYLRLTDIHASVLVGTITGIEIKKLDENYVELPIQEVRAIINGELVHEMFFFLSFAEALANLEIYLIKTIRHEK